MKPLRVRYGGAERFSEEVLRAYIAYHGDDYISLARRRELAAHIRSTLEQVGAMGFDEQVHEGRTALEELEELGTRALEELER